MNKNIVLLSDGTGNGSAKAHKTNVWRLYDALDLHLPGQIAFYDDGVGSQEFLPLKIIGGVFGFGLKRNVREMYKYLCRNYEDGDRIYLFGFSRGAFTVRMLAGMVCYTGLCRNDGTEAELDKKAKQNYNAFRSRFGGGLLTQGLRRFFGRNDPLEGARYPDIEFIGVWDTVDAYGFPIDELAMIWDRLIYPLYFPNRMLSRKVKKGCHAISVDDERHTFHPVLWDESQEDKGESQEDQTVSDEGEKAGRIEQVWFPGVHSDVGGGYPKYTLALVAMDWMISKVEAVSATPDSPGLHFIPERRRELRCHSDWNGPQHDSRSGVSAYYRYKPRNIEAFYDDMSNGRQIVPKIHRSVFERIRSNVIPYAPTGLPECYEVVETKEALPDSEPESEAIEGDNNMSKAVPVFESKSEAAERAKNMSKAVNVITWRRRLYLALILTTAALVLTPVYLPWIEGGLCVGAACIFDPLLQLAIKLLPGIVAPWLYALSQNPIWLLGFIIVFLVLFRLKDIGLTRTQEYAMKAWAKLKKMARLYDSEEPV